MLNDEITAEDITAQTLSISKRDSLAFAIKENKDLQELVTVVHLMMQAHEETKDGIFENPQQVLEELISHVGIYVERRAVALEKLVYGYKFSEAIHESAIKFKNKEKFH